MKNESEKSRKIVTLGRILSLFVPLLIFAAVLPSWHADERIKNATILFAILLIPIAMIWLGNRVLQIIGWVLLVAPLAILLTL